MKWQTGLFFLANPFHDLYSSYDLVRSLSDRWGIDDSHNHRHSKEVLFWSVDIIRHLPPPRLTSDTLLMIGRCCLLHDLMDSKYSDLSDVVETHLLERHSPQETNIMMRVMGTMSYSKIADNNMTFPSWNTTQEADVFHIVREADLLSSFNIARMVEYRLARFPHMDSAAIRLDMTDLYEKRMGRLAADGLFVHPHAEHRARQLDAICRLRLHILDDLDILSGNLDILRIINHLSIHRLILDYDMLLQN